MSSYLFALNPGNATYASTSVLVVLACCTLLVLGGFSLQIWRKRLENPVTKKLTRFWPRLCVALGGMGFVLVVARVEEIQILAMRFLLILWFIVVGGLAALQWKLFRSRNYQILPRERREDPREKYLPDRRRH